MEIDKATKKETSWRIKLDKDKVLVVNAIEDSTSAEPSSVTFTVTEGDKKINVSMVRDKFLNLIGVLDSFSQVCLGVEPKLEAEDYAPREAKTTEKKAEVVEPAEVVPKPRVEPMAEAKVEVKPEVKHEVPVRKPELPPRKPEIPASKPEPKKPEEPARAPAVKPEPKKPDIQKAPSSGFAESRMMSALTEPQKPKMVAFPPRFPSTMAKEPDEEKEEDSETSIPAVPAIPSPPAEDKTEATKEPAASAPASSKAAPPAKATKQAETSDETAPEWDPW
nr:hypothetical protein [Candidatus Sigynarchaeota archaeon]